MDRGGRAGRRRHRGVLITGPEYTWIDEPSQFAALLDTLAGEERVGLDTEFHRERTYVPDVAVVQLGWDGGIVLVDALAVDLAPLAELLQSETRIVMHACTQDLEVLDVVCGVEPKHLFDTQIAAGFVGMSTPSLAALCRHHLGVDLAKGDRLTDWKRRPLPDSALTYAAADVLYLFELEDILLAELAELDRVEWAAAECRVVARKTLDRPPPEQAWWRIKEAKRLKGRTAAIAQTLAAWREDRARRVDRPLRFVLPDLAVVGIAQKAPTDRSALAKIRGLDQRHLRSGADDELLDAVARGQALDLDAVIRPTEVQVDRDLRPAVSLLSAWISQFARDHQLDPALLATRGDLEAFLGGQPGRLDEGWRAELVADRIRRLVNGDAALAFAGEGRLVAEARSNIPI